MKQDVQNWVLDGWPEDEQDIRVFTLSPHDVVYTILENFSQREIKTLLDQNALDVVQCIRKTLEMGLEDWSQLIADAIYFKLRQVK